MDLPVRVAFGDVVEIDQGQFPHGAARERLGRPRADAADADHRDARALERGERIGAVEPGDAAEAPGAIRVKLAGWLRSNIVRRRNGVGTRHTS